MYWVLLTTVYILLSSTGAVQAHFFLNIVHLLVIFSRHVHRTEASIQLGFSRPTSDLSTSSEVRYLVGNNEACNSGRRQSRHDARNERRNRHGTDIATTARG